MANWGNVLSRSGWWRRRAEIYVYALFAALATLLVGCWFYASLRLQTHYTAHLPLAQPGEWSAPLDDVFIHFDFARATARGFPFQWSEGNGYSSGGTSLLYPFVLALGYWIGFRGLSLMVWAGVVACVCVFACLLGARRLFRDLPRWTSYLAVFAFLGAGVLSWSLFSGMEVAFFLALWMLSFIAWDDLCRGEPASPSSDGPRSWRELRGQALLLGLACALLVATRPEAAPLVAVFSLSAAFRLRPEVGDARALLSVTLSAVPAVLVVLLHALANRWFTGEATAAGALAKLELHHPHLGRDQVLGAWWFHIKYQFMRVGDYHLSDTRGYGFIPFGLAALALLFRTTRRYALLLWVSALLWVVVVALNGQVRWQNERYTMPALAWVMFAAGLGLGALVGQPLARGRRGLVLRALAAALALSAVGLYGVHQRSRYRDQVWFFGRASRNIRDQHVRAGRLLSQLRPPPGRVLVGDAGAIPYISDLPALDIIGLGGYKRQPFARATRQGVGAALELLEAMPAQERPSVLAIYPSWWGTLPLWFGEVVASVPVTGNVICGGSSKVIYRPNWQAFDGSDRPFTAAGRRVVDRLDFADLLSESAHDLKLVRTKPFVAMKMLPHPRRPHRDLWDAGRILKPGAKIQARIHVPGPKAKILLRVAPSRDATLRFGLLEQSPQEIPLTSGDMWQEISLPLPSHSTSNLVVSFTAAQREIVLYHLFILANE